METQQFSNGWSEFDDDAQTVVVNKDLSGSSLRVIAPTLGEDAPPPTQRSIEATPSGPSRAFARTMMGPGVQNFEAERVASALVGRRGDESASRLVDEPSPIPWANEQPSPIPWVAKAAAPAVELPLPFRDAPRAARIATPGLPVAPLPPLVASPARAQVIPAAPARPVVIRTPSHRPPPPASATPAAMAIDLPTGVRERASRELMGGPPSVLRGGNKASALLAAASLLITLVLGFVLLTPRTGQLRIAPAVERGRVERADVFVDGVRRCEAVPCLVSGLSKGEHGVEIRASGYHTEARIETVSVGKERLALIPIRPVLSLAGFRASAPVAGVRALVDGADRGPLPLDLADLTPGDHRIRFVGPGFDGGEQALTLGAGEIRDFGVVHAAAQAK